MRKKLHYIGEDYWSRPTYKDETGQIFVDVDMTNDPRWPISLHTVTPNFGEPDCPVHFDFVVEGWTDSQQEQRNFKFDYMMLGKLKFLAQDYLRVKNEGGAHAANLYLERSYGRKDAMSIIEDMRKYFAVLPKEPEWCKEEDIKLFEKEVTA